MLKKLALALALAGAPLAAAEAGTLWYEAGMTYDARHADDQAIEAFTRAITGKPEGHAGYATGAAMNSKPWGIVVGLLSVTAPPAATVTWTGDQAWCSV